MKDYSYYIPGYTGFCPELKEHFGETYGRATRHIIYEKPHLKDRLAPVFYKYRRQDRSKKTYRKYPDQEKERFVPQKIKPEFDVLDPNQSRYRPVYEDGDTGVEKHRKYHEEDDIESRERYEPSRGKYRVDYQDGDTRQGFYQANYDGGDASPARCMRECGCGDSRRVKYRAGYEDCDRIRKVERKCVCPKYMYVETYTEFVPPEKWVGGRQLAHAFPETYSVPTTSCAHVKEYLEGSGRMKAPFTESRREGFRECPENRRQKIDSQKDPRIWRMPRVKQHRTGGVIPKYTGHIPGMLFSFGESYGPLSDRLLRKHHDNQHHGNQRHLNRDRS